MKKKATFLLDKDSIVRLQKLARDEAIPESILVDQMLVQYLATRATSSLSEYIPIRKILLTRLLEKFSETEVTAIAKDLAKIATKKLIQRLRQDYHIVSSVGVVDALVRISNLKYKYEVNYGIHKFTIDHNLGIKWSLYLYEIYSSVLRQFRFKKIEIEYTKNQITFTIIMRTIL